MMRQLQTSDIKSIELSTIEDNYLNTLLKQKEEAKNYIINFRELIPHLLKDCLIEFITEKTKSSPCTYEAFIKSINSETRTDSTLKRNFSTFLDNVLTLNSHRPYMLYTPPFVSYICKSIIPTKKNQKQNFRNYEYIIFNSRIYSYIICHSDCIPYFHKDKHLSFLQCKKFFELYNKTCEFDISSLTERWISQHYIEKYFRLLLFARTWNILEKAAINDSKANEAACFEIHLDNFLSLCNLLQESSGIKIKDILFDKIKRTYFNEENDIFFSKSVSSDYFKQYVAELIIWNNIIVPYTKELYFNQFDALLNKDFTNLNMSDLYEQFSSLIDSCNNSKQTDNDKNLCNILASLDNNIKELDNLSSQLLKEKNPSTQYFHALDKFYGTSPYKVMSDYRYFTTYAEIYKQARLDLDVQLISNGLNTFKLLNY